MKTLKFKTNINCGGCISTVTPFLEKEPKIKEWNVDTNDKEKILTVKGEDISEEKVIATVNEAGFKAEPISQGIFGKMFK